MSNDNREQDDKGKEKGREKSRCGGDIREHTMDNDCSSSKKGRCCRVKVRQLETGCPLRRLFQATVTKAEVKVTSFEKLELLSATLHICKIMRLKSDLQSEDRGAC